MKWNNFAYLFKEGIRGIFKHGFMSFAAVCVTVACLLVVGVFSSLIYNLNIMVEDLNKTNEVIAYVDEELSDAEAKSISTKFVSIDNIYSANFKTRDEALKEFVADHPDDVHRHAGVRAEQDILPRKEEHIQIAEGDHAAVLFALKGQNGGKDAERAEKFGQKLHERRLLLIG